MTTHTSAPKSKVFDHTQHIDAHVETVWHALTDGEELKKWFPIDARVKPGLGGSVFLSWGPACEGEAPITLWEPGRALGWIESHDNGAVKIAVEFHIAPDPDPHHPGTILRIVHSGFGQGQKWDDMYDSIANGWKFELKSLNHYLTRHAGQSRQAVWLPVPSNLPIDAAWRTLAAENGAGLLKRSRLSGHREGDAYSFTGPDNRAYSGRVLRSVDNKTFAGTIKELDDALLRIEIERSGAASMACIWLSVWGKNTSNVQSIADAWAARVSELVGSAS